MGLCGLGLFLHTEDDTERRRERVGVRKHTHNILPANCFNPPGFVFSYCERDKKIIQPRRDLGGSGRDSVSTNFYFNLRESLFEQFGRVLRMRGVLCEYSYAGVICVFSSECCLLCIGSSRDMICVFKLGFRNNNNIFVWIE